MTDDQLPRIVLEPTDQPSSQVVPQFTPLQAVPQRGTPAAVVLPPTDVVEPKDDLKTRQAELQQQLEAVTKDEAGLLSNMKDWVAKLQGDETKQQAIERELLELNTQISTLEQVPAGPSKAELEKQLREAEGALKVVLMQQKIEEKKAFDNYSAGGMKREELLQAMEHINSQFDKPVAEAKAKVAAAQQQLSGEPVPVASVPVVQPEPIMPEPTAPAEPQSMPLSPVEPVPPAATEGVAAQTSAQPITPAQQHIVQALATLESAKTGEQHQVLVELPAEGKQLTILRSKDGNGIVVNGIHFFDADLIRAGLGAEDVMNLPQEV